MATWTTVDLFHSTFNIIRPVSRASRPAAPRPRVPARPVRPDPGRATAGRRPASAHGGEIPCGAAEFGTLQVHRSAVTRGPDPVRAGWGPDPSVRRFRRTGTVCGPAGVGVPIGDSTPDPWVRHPFG
ncbi:hypothetical protein GCM10022207_67970 [Streptomyces lannensis]|uniref:Uncharacterized protein n=1 Tax=Streptomyces lannensis TaxID=766498 RepID=A0ABP7KZ83_9ACTN